MPSSPLELDPVVVPLVTGRTVLDVGCGFGKWGMLITSNWYDADTGGEGPPQIDGVDAFEPALERAGRTGLYRRIWKQELPSPLDGEWDTVVATEIVEHIHQEQVGEFLDELERVASRRVIISTPNWPYYRDGMDTLVGFSEHEAHHSYVSRKFLRDRGYHITGVGLRLNPCSFGGRVARRLHAVAPLESLTRVAVTQADVVVAHRDV